jgi:antitoxin component of MazEF toxin-antitoxin module
MKMGIEIKKEGIFIPNKVLEEIGLEDFEVEIAEAELKIRPKSYTKRMFGFFKAEEKLVDKVIKDYERETERKYFGEE